MVETTAFPRSRAARGVAIQPIYQNMGSAGSKYREVRIAIIGQGGVLKTYDTTKRRFFSAAEAGAIFDYGTPIHLAIDRLLPQSGVGVGGISVTVYPIAQPTSGDQATGSITPSGTPTKTQTFYVDVNNILSEPIVVLSGDTVADICDKVTAAISAVLKMPITATDGATAVTTTVKWDGLSGNNVDIKILSPDDAEISFAIVQPTGGAGVPDITPALAQIGNVWETHIINCLDYTDSAELTEIATLNEGRWGAEENKQFLSFVGTAEPVINTVTAVTDARKTDRTNVILTNPGSRDLPFVIAADQVCQIAKRAAENPPYDYGSMKCPGLTPGSDSAQWGSSMRDAAVKAGCSTVKIKDGVVNLSDIVTCYHPTGEEPPPYRYVVDKEKLDTAIHNVRLEFDGPRWDGVPLIPDGQASKNPAAKRPSDAMAALYRIIDRLALDAIISDPDFAKKNSTASIDSANPKRLNILFVFKLAGNANVISIDLAFGFHTGG